MPRGTSVIPQGRPAITNAPAVSATPASRYAAQTMRALAEEADRIRRERIQPLVDEQAANEGRADVESGELREVPINTRYGQMYQKSAEIALTTKVERDAREEAMRLYQTVGGDVEAFKQQYGKWANETAAQYPPGMARVALNASEAAGRGVVEDILNENFKQQQNEAIEGIRIKQAESREQVLSAVRDGDQDAIATAMQEYTDATSVRAGFHGEVYSDEQAAVDLEDLQFDVLVTASIPEVDEAFEQGGSLGARLRIQALVDTEMGLTPGQATTYKSRLDERINNLLMIANEVEAQEAAQFKAEEDAIKDMQDAANIQATTLYTRGELTSEWLLNNAKRLGDGKYETWSLRLMSDAEDPAVMEAASTTAYVDLVFDTFDGEPSEVLLRAGELARTGAIDKTMFNNIRTLETAAADDRVRDATNWVKAQFRSESGTFSFLDMDANDAQQAAEVVNQIAAYSADNPDATRDDVMNFAFRQVAESPRRDRLSKTMPALPGRTEMPKSKADLDVYTDWLAADGGDLLDEDELIDAFRALDRWSIYLDTAPTEGTIGAQ